MSHNQFDEEAGMQEAMTVSCAAFLRSSWIHPANSANEPFDVPLMMIPIAYAMFQVLAEACIATGHDEQAWWSFLRESLAEAIDQAEMKAFG